jgi:hypothetical protein
MSAPQDRTFAFKRAARTGVHVMIGLAGGTGSGKTFSALELATGIAGNERFAVIDTENGRALHYAPPEGQPAEPGKTFDFDHTLLAAPFRPAAYLEAIMAAERAGYPVIVIDSMSHEHAGEGGLLDWHEEILDRMAGDDWKKRDANTMRAWIEPKMAHKAMVQHLLQVRAHLIFCFRAEEKIEIKREDGKTVIKPKEGPTGAQGWLPVCEKNLPYELTASFLLKSDKPGYVIPIKLEAQHRMLFHIATPAGSLPDRPIGRATGAAIAKWARGESLAPTTAARTLGDVVAAFRAATTGAELKAAWSLVGDLVTTDRGAAEEAYKERWNALKAAAEAAKQPGTAG